MGKRLIVFMFLFFDLFNLNSYLSDPEQERILQKCEITEETHPEIKGTLDL